MTDAEAHEYITRYFRLALEESDLDLFADLYAEDAVLEDPVGTPPLRGRAAIREFLGQARALMASAKPTIHLAKAAGGDCAVHWSVEVRSVHGQTIVYDGIGVFMFDAAGKLRHVKEFYDVADLALLFGGATETSA